MPIPRSVRPRTMPSVQQRRRTRRKKRSRTCFSVVSVAEAIFVLCLRWVGDIRKSGIHRQDGVGMRASAPEEVQGMMPIPVFGCNGGDRCRWEIPKMRKIRKQGRERGFFCHCVTLHRRGRRRTIGGMLGSLVFPEVFGGARIGAAFTGFFRGF